MERAGKRDYERSVSVYPTFMTAGVRTDLFDDFMPYL
jgi:hypothetical protein